MYICMYIKKGVLQKLRKNKPGSKKRRDFAESGYIYMKKIEGNKFREG